MRRDTVIFLVFILGVMFLSGCVAVAGAAAGGAGTALWLSEKVTADVTTTYEKAIGATERALAALDLAVTKKTVTDEITQIKSKYSDSSEIWIDIRPLTEKTAKIDVRVGIRGDSTAANRILEAIKKRI